jgi:hypothetical protein
MSDRFRFRFTLRTLLIAVTLFCVWIAPVLRTVWERKAVLRELAKVVVPFATTGRYQTLTSQMLNGPEDYGHLQISVARRLLGDEPCVQMYLPETTPLDLVYRTERAFPEARLYCDWYDGPAAFRDSLYARDSEREPNRGRIFKTGRFER